ncbi:hypothetical protein DFH06DRAFT_1340191 [Mycena polygramma]|nr:hypothetical protein DFH06DRAFT_1340191 [Mycena polygramma]
MPVNPPNPLPESLFHGHLATNYVPTEDEIAQIRAHLIPYEEELARLEALIRDLTVQRGRVQDHIESHKALISQPRRMPQDVVERVFLECLPTGHNPVMDAAEAPLLLGRICSAWRAIAFSMQILWASVHISPAFILRNEEGKSALIQWLERSGELPLRLSVHYSADEDDNEVMIPILLRFMLTMGGMFFTAISADLHDYVPSTPFTWDHLAHLSLQKPGSHLSGGLSPASAYRLMKGCPQLISLHFSLATRLYQDILEPQRLWLPSLQFLTIVDHGARMIDLATLMKELYIPHLVSLHFLNNLKANYHGSWISDIAFLERLAQRSPKISDLGVTFKDVTRVSLTAALQLFPILTRFTLEYRDTADLFAVLTPCPDSESSPANTWSSPTDACPALEELTIKHAKLNEDEWMTFLQKRLQCPFLNKGMDVSLHYQFPATKIRWGGTAWNGLDKDLN